MSFMAKLLKDIRELKIDKGVDATQVDAEVEKAKEIIAERQKANEAMHTDNTGFWKELVKDAEQKKVIDMARDYSALLPNLPGYHGIGLGDGDNVIITGEIPLFRGNSELRNKSQFNAAIGQTTQLPTGKVSIPQGMFRHDILVSYRLLDKSVIDLYDKYMEEIAKSMAKTIDAYMINADGALTGNVNYDGNTFTESDRENYYFLQGGTNAKGLRKHAIASGNVHEIGILSEDDYLDLSEKLGGFANRVNDVIIVQQRKIQNQLLKLETYKNASINGQGSTVRDQAAASVWWYDIVINEFIPLGSKADGKVSNDPEDNTKGQALMFYAPAVQYGFWQELRIDVKVEPGKWIRIVPFFEFWCAIVNWEAQTDKTVALAVDITQ